MSAPVWVTILTFVLSSGQFSDDTGIRVFKNEKACEGAITTFLNKYDIAERDHCLKMSAEKYKIIFDRDVYLNHQTDEWPAAAGYRKTRKGRWVWFCHNEKEEPCD